MRCAAVFLLLLACGEAPALPLDASVDGTVEKDAASDAAKDATNDACVQPNEQCGEPCPGTFVAQPLLAPTAKSACTAKQIDDLWALCFGPSADLTGCKALLVANDPCTACLVTPEAKPPWGALVQDGNDLIVRANVPGCLAVTSADPSCGDGAERMRQCDVYYCATVCWPYDPSPPLPQYEVCHSHARTGFCASFAAKDCAPADAGPTAQCAGDDFHATYVAVATVLCAAPVKDAGGD